MWAALHLLEEHTMSDSWNYREVAANAQSSAPPGGDPRAPRPLCGVLSSSHCRTSHQGSQTSSPGDGGELLLLPKNLCSLVLDGAGPR